MPGRWSGAQERTSGSEGAQKRVYFQDKKKIETKFKILFYIIIYIFYFIYFANRVEGLQSAIKHLIHCNKNLMNLFCF